MWHVKLSMLETAETQNNMVRMWGLCAPPGHADAGVLIHAPKLKPHSTN
jgi:hypothetical protein